MENQTVQKRFTHSVKEFFAKLIAKLDWNPGGCSIWIFGDNDSASKDMYRFFDVREERTRR